jgi:ATP-dependent helicase HrpB
MRLPLETLPIDASLNAIVDAIRRSPALVISAPPGTGKTTRVPPALLAAGLAAKGEIWILEPRRIAARLAAARVASELGEKLGESVGYSIRFETVGSAQTRIRFVTEGILARRIVQDPRLEEVSIIIMDEFHERHLATDLALAFARKLQQDIRRDLKIIVMSATLDPAPIAAFLGNAPVIASQGQRFDLRIEYEERDAGAPIHAKVAAGVVKLVKNGAEGDILVFLPGAAEIRLAAEALDPLASKTGWTILPLHGDLPTEAQARAVQPSSARKLILATNVAESSITIPGVTAVVDSGLARVAGHSNWTGLPALSLAKISKSSAAQRAGRAGRLGPGTAVRLYSRHDFECRPEFDIAEIHRADLAETVLTLHGAGIRDLKSFPWFEPPANAAIEAAENLLGGLGALKEGKLTEAGRRMLRFPLHPRLARLVVESDASGIGYAGCLVAALLSERDIRIEERSHFGKGRSAARIRGNARSDLLELVECFQEAEHFRFDPTRTRALGIDARAAEAVSRAKQQLCRLLSKHRDSAPLDEDGLLISILAAFPDRVARRRTATGRDFVLAGGGTAKLAETSVVHQSRLIAAVDAGERFGARGSKDSAGILIRLASEIEPEWLAGLFPDDINRKTELVWNETAGRVDEVDRTFYRELVLEETVRPAAPSEAVSQFLFKQIGGRVPSLFRDGDRVPAFQERFALLAVHFPSAEIRPLTAESIAEAGALGCEGKRSLDEIARVSICDVLLNRMTGKQKDLLARETPERITLPHGRKVVVHYEAGKPPWIESALQDFFGMKATPAICAGRVPLTVHLLAPSRRPLQVTQDLPGFWQHHYPELRRQLERRYPKHHWPSLET